MGHGFSLGGVEQKRRGSGAVEGRGKGRVPHCGDTEAGSWKLCPYPDAPLHTHSHMGTGESPAVHRLRQVPDKACQEWP